METQLPPSDSAMSRILERPWQFFLACLGLFIVFNWQTLSLPPYWDGCMGIFYQGSWLAKNNLDYSALLAQPRFQQGGPNVTPMSLIAYLYALSLHFLSPGIAFILLHLLIQAASAGITTLTFFLAKKYLSQRNALLLTVCLAVDPIFNAQTAIIYNEIPVAFTALLAFYCFVEQRFILATCALFLALLFKGSAMIPGLAFLVSAGLQRILPVPKLQQDTRIASIKTLLLSGLPIAAITPVYLWNHNVNRTAEDFQIVSSSAFSNLESLPGLAPFTFGLYFLLIVFSLKLLTDKEQQLKWRDEPQFFNFYFTAATLTFGFFASYCFHSLPLVRYFCLILAPLYMLVTIAVQRIYGEAKTRYFLLAFVALNLVNINGTLYPELAQLSQRSGSHLERSRLFLEDQSALIELCEWLEKNHKDDKIIVDEHFIRILSWPQLGYVDSAFANLYCVADHASYQHKKLVNPDTDVLTGYYAIVSDNGFASQQTRALSLEKQDEILFQHKIGNGRLLFVKKFK